MNTNTSGEMLREVARLYTRAQRQVADCCGSGSTQCHLLVELGRAGPLAPSELGQRLALEKSWVSRAVDALVGRGWVSKAAHPSDARSWLVTLTPEGKAQADELNRSLNAHARQVLKPLSAAERELVAQALPLLLRALREEVDIPNCCTPLEGRP